MKVRAEGRVFVKKLELKKLLEFHTKTANMSIKVGPTHKKSPCPTSGVSPKVVVVNLEMLEGSAQTAASERRAPASGSREAADQQQQQQQEHLEPQQKAPRGPQHTCTESSCGSGPPLALPAPPGSSVVSSPSARTSCRRPAEERRARPAARRPGGRVRRRWSR